MSTSKTPELNLHSWVGTDYFSRIELNKNFTDLDAKFDQTAGHTHTGALGDGTKIPVAGLATDVITLVGSKAPLSSPGFTGVPTVPTAAVNTNTQQAASVAFVLAQAGNTPPVMDGVATAGVSTKFAREDQRHPTDTTRAALASPVFTGIPTVPTAAVNTNTLQAASTAFVAAALAALINASPAYLDTLNEFATAIGNDPNFSSTMLALIGAKASQVSLDATNTAAVTHQVKDASETVQGHVELATNLETTTGTDRTRAVTPSGLKAMAIPLTQKGAVNGVPTLGSSGLIPTTQIPSSIARIATGTYTGTGVDRTITVGFTPKFIYISSLNNNKATGMVGYSDIANLLGGDGGGYASILEPSMIAYYKIAANGFFVIGDATYGFNVTGLSYGWVVMG